MKTAKKNIRHLTPDELNGYFETLGEKKFRAKQVYEWLWLKQAQSFDAMTNLSKELRAKLADNFSLPALTVDATQYSADGTVKSRFKTHDGHLVEGVLIPTDDRKTACVSSQIGCSLSCKFCATGYMDRKRNLDFDEIYDEVVLINQQSERVYEKKLTNIVFMGMGEPLLNYRNVLKSIERITSPDGLGMSPAVSPFLLPVWPSRSSNWVMTMYGSSWHCHYMRPMIRSATRSCPSMKATTWRL
jgi:23S rRNA (adenine2503-C2)-methyltransferase